MLVYAVTIFVSAVLLFLVQPLIGKVILPWFGGSSAVWSATLLFFQVLLLLGYVYGHLIVRKLDRRRQVWVHLGVLAASLAALGLNLVRWRTPITPEGPWTLAVRMPAIAQVLLTLTVTVGLPYFVLSTTSPLVQAWFAARFRETSPYRLYALSNLGSILALAAYPFLLEPAFSTYGQASVWFAGYLAFAVGLGWAASSSFRHANARRRAETVRPPTVEPEASFTHARGPSVRWWHPLLWLVFSAIGSVLLLGTTNQITQNVTAVPLLWVGPLVLYLLTFVIVFGGTGNGDTARGGTARSGTARSGTGYSRWTLLLFFGATQIFGYVFPRGNVFPMVVQLSVYGLVLFSACLVSHGEMARLRPQPQDLTAFYLMMGVGGARGGVFVNLVAPAVFAGTWEFPIALLACWVFIGLALALGPGSALVRRRWAQVGALIVVSLGLLSSVIALRSAVRAFYFGTLSAERNFYGVLRIQSATLGDPPGDAYRMVHGTTIHGVQYASPDLRDTPTSYFGPTSGVGLAVRQLQGSAEPLRIGVLGLGVGTLAAYGREGDLMRFYEIDPEVIRYAHGLGGYFSYLQDSAAEIAVADGDARLSLAQELERGDAQAFDLLAVDVFSGDAPPVHLLTREAFDLYLAHLAEDGLLAVNISTTHLDLAPLLAALARERGLDGVIVADPGDDEAIFRSRWVVIGRSPQATRGSRWDAHPDLQEVYDPGLRVWTDSYSNVLQVLR